MELSALYFSVISGTVDARKKKKKKKKLKPQSKNVSYVLKNGTFVFQA